MDTLPSPPRQDRPSQPVVQWGSVGKRRRRRDRKDGPEEGVETVGSGTEAIEDNCKALEDPERLRKRPESLGRLEEIVAPSQAEKTTKA